MICPTQPPSSWHPTGCLVPGQRSRMALCACPLRAITLQTLLPVLVAGGAQMKNLACGRTQEVLCWPRHWHRRSGGRQSNVCWEDCGKRKHWGWLPVVATQNMLQWTHTMRLSFGGWDAKDAAMNSHYTTVIWWVRHTDCSEITQYNHYLRPIFYVVTVTRLRTTPSRWNSAQTKSFCVLIISLKWKSKKINPFNEKICKNEMILSV